MRRARPILLLSLLLVPQGSWLATGARIVGGGAVGLAAGTLATVGALVARARFQNHYLESTREVVSWQGAPAPLGAVAGGAAGTAGSTVLGRVALGTVAGGVAGAAAGTLLGVLLSSESTDQWAAGTMGGAVGVVAGFVFGWMAGWRRRRWQDEAAGGEGGGEPGGAGGGAGGGVAGAVRALSPMVVALLAVTLSMVGCGQEDPGPRPDVMAVPPNPGRAEDVVILIGDAGKARYRYYPVIPRVAAEVEAWAERIGRDSAVTVVSLGDVIYPDGMHDPGDPGYPVDSARVADQVDVVRSPGALEHESRLYYVAGNHDWGLREDRPGVRRLRNLDAFLDRARDGGANVDLLPPAGTGGPAVVDVGSRLRLILLDTAWWLFDAEPAGKDAVIAGVATAIATAGDRRIVMAAHHPFSSAGPHGGLRPIWSTFGVQTLLARSGALLQDLNSRPYRDLLRRLGEVFADVGRPLVFAGGHEHSLQLIAHDLATAPRYSIVSGSASKLTGSGRIEGTVFQASAPGYVQLVIREDGAVDMEVVGAPDRYLSCPENEPDELEWERCMAEGERSFETLFTARLAAPGTQ